MARRNTEISVWFHPETNLALGWAYSLLPAFSKALDIQYTMRKDKESGEQKKTKTEGSIPKYGFGAGDTFYKPALARILPTPEARAIMTGMIQVLNASPDTLEVRYTEVENGINKPYADYRLSQDNLALWLRTGFRPTSAEKIISSGFFISENDPSVDNTYYNSEGLYVGKNFNAVVKTYEVIATKINYKLSLMYGIDNWSVILNEIRHAGADLYYLHCFPSSEPNPIWFRSDRIISITDHATGQMFEGPNDILAFIRKFSLI